MQHNMHGSSSEEQLDFALLLSEANFDAPSGFTALDLNQGPPSATVSPQDLFLDHDLSAPNSNVLTDLTSPSPYGDTPYDVSPAFETTNFGHAEWTPLFNTEDSFTSAPYNHGDMPSLSTSLLSINSNNHEMIRTPSASESPPDMKADALHRLTSASGVSKTSRRTLKDLPPIEVDEEDERAVKRARNTLAARKSRQKKRDTEDMLRIALDAMTAERDKWKMLAISHGAPIPES